MHVGGAAWTLIALYFVAEFVTARAWPTPYAVSSNSVSNLGATGCDAATLCSPLHAVINTAFILTSMLIVIGALTLRDLIPASRYRSAALVSLTVTSASGALTGLVPVDVDPDLHFLVATPTFAARNAAMVFVALALVGRWRIFSLWTGLCCSVGCVGVAAILVPGTSFGITERISLYPFTVWVVSAGIAAVVAGLPSRQRATEHEPAPARVR